MCLKVQKRYVDFFEAYEVCRHEKSFIAVPQNRNELEMFRDVIIPYNLTNSVIRVRYGKRIVNHGGFWGGLKSWGRITFAIDGTNSSFTVDTSPNSRENNCQAMYYKTVFNFKDDYGVFHNYTGLSDKCTSMKLPYMCQRFADQSLTKNLQ
uniref:Uncharacterized protein n=1 Tax=Panagrolaimus davidi TaxID=227884 RepID=A0A914R5H3_9BILA